MNKSPTYLVRWKGQQFGPFTKEIIDQKVREHELSLAHEVQADGKWRSLRSFLNLQAQVQEQDREKIHLQRMQDELDQREATIQKTRSQLQRAKVDLDTAKHQPRSPAYLSPAERPTPATSTAYTSERQWTQPSKTDYWAALTSRKHFPITSIIVVSACVGIYLVMIFSGVSLFEPTTGQLIQWGANVGPLVLAGQWWRLFTSCFVHVGLVHLVMNMWCLISLGAVTERLYGSVRFAMLYLLAGLGGSVAGFVVHPEIVSAGASGAVFGVAGGVLALSVCLRKGLPTERFKNLIVSMLAFIGYNLFNGFTQPHIDNAAHIGGLVTGFVFGLPLAISVRTVLQANSGRRQVAHAGALA